MEQLVNFVTNHWVLSLLLVSLLLAFIVNELIQRRLTAFSITPEHVVQLINHQHAIVIDIRSETAFKEGHILGSHHIAKQPIDKKIKSLQKSEEKPIILICTSGQESSKMATELKRNDFSVFTINGGLQAWRTSGLPLVKS